MQRWLCVIQNGIFKSFVCHDLIDLRQLKYLNPKPQFYGCHCIWIRTLYLNPCNVLTWNCAESFQMQCSDLILCRGFPNAMFWPETVKRVSKCNVLTWNCEEGFQMQCSDHRTTFLKFSSSQIDHSWGSLEAEPVKGTFFIFVFLDIFNKST